MQTKSLIRQIIIYSAIVVLFTLCLSTCKGCQGYDGVIINKSSYTLYVLNPLNEDKYVTLKPGQSASYNLDEGIYTFKAYYTDWRYFASISFRVNAVNGDAEVDGAIYDWAVIFEDFWGWGDVQYYA